MPLGSVLGPTLFLLFIKIVSDIFDGLNVTCKLYADDIKLYSCFRCSEPFDDLSSAINRLVNSIGVRNGKSVLLLITVLFVV